MNFSHIIPVTKEAGFSFEIWRGLLGTILKEDFSTQLKEEHEEILLKDYYNNNYTIQQTINNLTSYYIGGYT